MRTKLFSVEASGATDIGRKRAKNEDSFVLVPECGLFVVADGMGGHAAGDVASKMAVDTLQELYCKTSESPELLRQSTLNPSKSQDENRLITGIKLANRRIYDAGRADSKKRSMGTTIVALAAAADAVYIGHVGDSRVYRFREGRLKQLTEDHSMLNEQIKAGNLTPEEAKNFPHTNVITRALGMSSVTTVDTRFEQLLGGDVYLLCSDGLCGPVSDVEIAEVIAQCASSSLSAVADSLVKLANANGGPDNVTAVLVRFVR